MRVARRTLTWAPNPSAGHSASQEAVRSSSAPGVHSRVMGSPAPYCSRPLAHSAGPRWPADLTQHKAHKSTPFCSLHHWSLLLWPSTWMTLCCPLTRRQPLGASRHSWSEGTAGEPGCADPVTHPIASAPRRPRPTGSGR